MEKLYNICLMVIILVLIYLSHLDRVAFITELKESREMYIEAISNIEIIKEDLSIIKTAVLKKED